MVQSRMVGASTLNNAVLFLNMIALGMTSLRGRIACNGLRSSEAVAFVHYYCLRSYRPRWVHSSTCLRLNRFLFEPQEVELSTTIKRTSPPKTTTIASSPTVLLSKQDFRTVHAAKILKLAHGDTVRAGIVGCEGTAGQYTDDAIIEWIPEAPVKKAEVLKNGNPPGSLRIHLHNLTLTESTEQQIPVSLILALPRPLQIGRILPMISQLGVEKLILTSAQKVPKDYFGSHYFRNPQVLREKLIEGLCQSGDVLLPQVHVVRNLRDFLGNNLDELFPKDEYARVVAHPQRRDSMEEPLRMGQVDFPSGSLSAKMVIAVGPEGGWTEPEELDLFIQKYGFQQVTLGTRTLRTDCAVVGLLTLANELCYKKNNDL